MIMSNKVTKYFLLFLTFIFLSGCASDGWYNQRERERFLRLDIKEQEILRKKCIELWGHECNVYKKPFPQEIERLKNKDSWKYKIRSWYYGIW